MELFTAKCLNLYFEIFLISLYYIALILVEYVYIYFNHILNPAYAAGKGKLVLGNSLSHFSPRFSRSRYWVMKLNTTMSDWYYAVTWKKSNPLCGNWIHNRRDNSLTTMPLWRNGLSTYIWHLENENDLFLRVRIKHITVVNSHILRRLDL